MSRTRVFVYVIALCGTSAIAVWAVSVNAFWRTNRKFAEEIVASAASGSPLYRELLPASELEAVSARRHLLVGKPREVLADETWGALEFGFCFPTGAFAYVTFATEGSPPKPAGLTVHEPTSVESKICLPR
jgi:hypothetical protein